MTNIVGPHGAGINETTVRPTDTASGAATDTWFKDCVGGVPGTGTKPPAVWFNKITALMRRAIRGMGVEENELDDDMLLKAIQASSSTSIEALLQNMPWFPEAQTVSGELALTASTGQVVVDTGQTFLWRGFKKFVTNDFSGGERTFATAASKTYHLRWYAPGHADAPLPTYPKGRFMLRDLADAAGYNPGALAESNSAFDTKHDTMLIARVVTNGANALTVTRLANKHVLREQRIDAATVTSVDNANHTFTGGTQQLTNWARTPIVHPSLRVASNSTVGASDDDMQILAQNVTRYAHDVYVQVDFAETLAYAALVEA